MATRNSGPWRRLGVGLTVAALGGAIALDLGLPSLVSFWGDRSFLVPLAAVLGAILWLTPARPLVGWAVAILAALWLGVAFTPLTVWLEDGLVRSDPPQAADLVYVFASRIQGDGDPSTDAMSRLLKGIELVAEGRAPRLAVSEIPPPNGRYLPVARLWMQTLAPRGQVLSVGSTVNTHDEALAVARLCREQGWRRVLAVTSPTHARRAAATLEKQALDVVSAPAIETSFDLERLVWPEDRRLAFGAIAHERLGLLVYRRRGWID